MVDEEKLSIVFFSGNIRNNFAHCTDGGKSERKKGKKERTDWNGIRAE